MENILSNLDLVKLYEEYQLATIVTAMLFLTTPFICCAKILVNMLATKFVNKKLPNYSNVFEKKGLYRRVSNILLLSYLTFCGEYLDQVPGASKWFLRTKDMLLQICTIMVIMWTIITTINVLVAIYQKNSLHSKVPAALYAQIFKIIVAICGMLAVASTILNISISALFTSLGAAAALLTLLFKDSLSALVASLQVTFQDVIRVGDWVTIEGKNVDGTVEQITITIVVIRNFDGTKTTVPTSWFLDNSVRNWRAMYEAGGRRIKRSISLDMDYVKTCDSKMLKEIKELAVMSGSKKSEEEEKLFDPKGETTNVTLFRYYINLYLAAHQGVHNDGFTFLVRQLEPTASGLPIELYIFANETDWGKYENIQASIFEHLLSVLPKFGLKPFQTVISLNKS